MSDMTREEAIKKLQKQKAEYLDEWVDYSGVAEAFDMAIEALQDEDADVYKAHEEEHLKIVNRIKELQYAIAKTQTIVGELVESADAEPTVIRSRTLMPTKDFKEWAKRIREENPNAIIIPCDAEVVSAKDDWIPCSERLPSESGNYLITVADLRLGHNGEHTVTMADFYAKAKKWNSIVDVYAWMPLPEPYKAESEEV